MRPDERTCRSCLVAKLYHASMAGGYDFGRFAAAMPDDFAHLATRLEAHSRAKAKKLGRRR